MRFITCLLLFWTLTDATEARNIKSTKLEDKPPHPLDGIRIIDGKDAGLGWFPHQVSLQRRPGYNLPYFHNCGGSIISKEWIVTAAHCVLEKYLSEMRVVSGTISLANGGTIHAVIQGFYNAKFNQSSSAAFRYDYAVLRVSPPFTFNSYVKPIPLGSGSARDLTCYASGWGRDNPGSSKLPSNLKYTWLRALTDNQCSPFIPGYVDEAHVCTWAPPSNICFGDSGGPLTCYDDEVQKLYGIASFVYSDRTHGVCSWGEPAGWADAASPHGNSWIRSACGNCI